MEWPEAIKRRTLKYYNVEVKFNKDTLVSINLLEYATVIIMHGAATQTNKDGTPLPHLYPIFTISFAGNGVKNKCVVLAAQRILARAKRLNVPSHYPIAVFGDNNNNNPVYMIGCMVQSAFRECARKVYNITDEDLLPRYNCHAVRVVTAVTLHCAGASDHTIMMRLHWKSGAFRGYLRNGPKLAVEHNRIVNNTDIDDMGICD